MIKTSDYKIGWFPEDIAEVNIIYKELLYFKERIFVRGIEGNNDIISALDAIISLIKDILNAEIEKLRGEYGIEAYKLLPSGVKKEAGIKEPGAGVTNNFFAGIKPEDLGIA